MAREMRSGELRELSTDELARRAGELAEELFRLKLKKATSQLENPMRPRQARRDLARVKTILAEKRAKERRQGPEEK